MSTDMLRRLTNCRLLLLLLLLCFVNYVKTTILRICGTSANQISSVDNISVKAHFYRAICRERIRGQFRTINSANVSLVDEYMCLLSVTWPTFSQWQLSVVDDGITITSVNAVDLHVTLGNLSFSLSVCAESLLALALTELWSVSCWTFPFSHVVSWKWFFIDKRLHCSAVYMLLLILRYACWPNWQTLLGFFFCVLFIERERVC